MRLKTLTSFSINLIGFIVISVIFSCHEDEYAKTATVRFESAQATYSENKGLVKIGVQLDRKRNVDTHLRVTWTTSDTTTFLGGDFETGTDVTIRAFNSSSFVQFSVLEDTQIDENDIIHLKIAEPIESKVKLSNNLIDSEHTLTISNDDHIGENEFQADLTWHRANAHDHISNVNFDLYLQKDVSIESGIIRSIGNTYAYSAQPGGFETIKLTEADPDQEYFLVAYFQQALMDEFVVYTLTLNGFGFTNETFSAKLNDIQVGAAVFFGPFVKSGRTFTNGGRKKNQEPKIYYSVDKALLEGLGRK